VAYQGRVMVDSSPLGGASIRFSWPIKPTFNLAIEPQ
jgi:two-component system sensor histidine kinase RstB